MSDDGPIFEPPDQDQLARRADDLRHRAELVRRYGWDQYRSHWSTGEVLGVALVLDDQTELSRRFATTEFALATWAFTLWGITRGEDDVAAGLAATLAWFDALREQTTGSQPPR
ncbi:hypothetical protein MU0083_000709 [[Mycobacterium] kokjensenii]|uniref:Uncharacterized protein n=1 Tax=[Mycobacterium] kokjensenii TaxID=3064287 RepID=A0ABN9MS86_9MYCO|nr:hypothetical protein [Mycolicibacter sp. MU0083]CAJ1494205.1 hypothetical protein MU0083_000709 [Mycolicibacter sp. MU0083]